MHSLNKKDPVRELRKFLMPFVGDIIEIGGIKTETKSRFVIPVEVSFYSV
jgi:hypothetical protein